MTVRRSLYCALAAGGVVSVYAASALAQTTATWQGAVSGNWTDGSRWSTNPDFPNNSGPNTFNAVINALGTPYTVSLDADITIQSLALESPDAILSMGASRLTLNAGLSIQGGIIVGGSLTDPLRVAGTTSFQGGLLMNLRGLRADGDLVFGGLSDSELCDSDINHGGTNASWSGFGNILLWQSSNLTFGSASTFTITSNASILWDSIGTRPTVASQGTIIKQSAGTTAFTDVAFDNTGTLDVRAGVFSTNGVTLTGGLLDRGTWRVSNGATIDLIGQAITTNRAAIEIDGASSAFAAADTIETNDTGARLSFSGGASFTTAGDFTNLGSLSVGAGSAFTVVGGSSLTNYNTIDRSLDGGEFVVQGVLRFDNAGVEAINARLTLDGPAADLRDAGDAPALADLRRITTDGALALKGSRSFTTTGDFKVEGVNSGTLDIEAGSAFTVAPGFSLENYDAGAQTLSEGEFVVAGSLTFDHSGIEILDSKVTLSGAAALIADSSNVNALDPLRRVDDNGLFRLANGANFTANPDDNTGFVFTVTTTGRVTVDEGSDLDILGDLANYNAGTFTDGEFSIQGRLRARNIADVETISSFIGLDSATGRITNFNNDDVFEAVRLITPTGHLRVSNGRDLSLTSATGVINNGRFTVGPSSPTDQTTVSIAQSYTHGPAAVTLIDRARLLVNGSVSIEGGEFTVRSAGLLSVGGSLAHADGLVTIASGASIAVTGAYAQSGGELRLDAGSLVAQGGYVQTGGSLTGNGFINGDVVLGGQVSPGFSSGRILVGGDTLVNPDARFIIELGGLIPGASTDGYDQFDILGGLTFEGGSAGILEIALLPGFSPRVGDVFIPIVAHGLDGAFAQIITPDLGNGLFFEPIYTERGLALLTTQIPAPTTLAPFTLGLLALRRRRTR
ncbi:MAG: hypothetical protein KF864_02635 [Phycisphaeraceae bacterium]|nr:hypothetical protein [Phycisphaeraceae bacterium]